MGETLVLLTSGALVVAGVFAWQRRRRAMMYDLRRWHDDPPGEAYDDMVDEDSGPYCHLCDHPNPLQHPLLPLLRPEDCLDLHNTRE